MRQEVARLKAKRAKERRFYEKTKKMGSPARVQKSASPSPVTKTKPFQFAEPRVRCQEETDKIRTNWKSKLGTVAAQSTRWSDVHELRSRKQRNIPQNTNSGSDDWNNSEEKNVTSFSSELSAMQRRRLSRPSAFVSPCEQRRQSQPTVSRSTFRHRPIPVPTTRTDNNAQDDAQNDTSNAKSVEEETQPSSGQRRRKLACFSPKELVRCRSTLIHAEPRKRTFHSLYFPWSASSLVQQSSTLRHVDMPTRPVFIPMERHAVPFRPAELVKVHVQLQHVSEPVSMHLLHVTPSDLLQARSQLVPVPAPTEACSYFHVTRHDLAVVKSHLSPSKPSMLSFFHVYTQDLKLVRARLTKSPAAESRSFFRVKTRDLLHVLSQLRPAPPMEQKQVFFRVYPSALTVARSKLSPIQTVPRPYARAPIYPGVLTKTYSLLIHVRMRERPVFIPQERKQVPWTTSELSKAFMGLKPLPAVLRAPSKQEKPLPATPTLFASKETIKTESIDTVDVFNIPAVQTTSLIPTLSKVLASRIVASDILFAEASAAKEEAPVSQKPTIPVFVRGASAKYTYKQYGSSMGLRRASVSIATGFSRLFQC